MQIITTQSFNKQGIYNISAHNKTMNYNLQICTIAILDFDSPILIKHTYTKESERLSINPDIIINKKTGLIFSLEHLVEELNLICKYNPDMNLYIIYHC